MSSTQSSTLEPSTESSFLPPEPFLKLLPALANEYLMSFPPSIAVQLVYRPDRFEWLDDVMSRHLDLHVGEPNFAPADNDFDWNVLDDRQLAFLNDHRIKELMNATNKYANRISRVDIYVKENGPPTLLVVDHARSHCASIDGIVAPTDIAIPRAILKTKVELTTTPPLEFLPAGITYVFRLDKSDVEVHVPYQ